MRILKFGGSSVGTLESFKSVLSIIERKANSGRIVVVISALGGITDQLISAIDKAIQNDIEYREILSAIKIRHHRFLFNFVPRIKFKELEREIDLIIAGVEKLLIGIRLIGEKTGRLSDSIISAGERLSRIILTAALQSKGIEAVEFEAAQFIKTNSEYGNAEVDFEATEKLLKEKFLKLKPGVVPVVNGFTGSAPDGSITTLGRSGSDYTATIIAGALNCDAVEIWTDVDGILSADPRLVPDARIIKQISYEDAAELAYLGAKVIFPKAMEPVKEKKIPILVLNTFNTEFEGTVITGQSELPYSEILSITSIKNLTSLTIGDIHEGASFSVLSKVVKSISDHPLPVISFNYSPAGRTISILAYSKKIFDLIDALRKELKFEMEHKLAGRLNFKNGISLITIIGKNKSDQTEVLKKISGAFESLGIKTVPYLSGTEGKNYSFIIDEVEADTAVKALHNSFFGTAAKTNVA